MDFAVHRPIRPDMTNGCHERVTGSPAPHDDQIVQRSWASAVLGMQQGLRGRGIGGLRPLRGTFLFQGLSRFLGHALSRRLIRHGTPLNLGAWVGPGSPSVRPFDCVHDGACRSGARPVLAARWFLAGPALLGTGDRPKRDACQRLTTPRPRPQCGGFAF